MKIAIDTTGGDLQNKDNIQAVINVARKNPNIIFEILKKPEDEVQEKLDNIILTNVTEDITCEVEQAMAFRKFPDSAINLGTKKVKNNEVDAFISSGSSGALISAATINVGRIAGIERPAFPIFFKNKAKNNFRMYLDVGASIDSRPNLLVNNAKLGKIYAESILKIDNPEIKLLNNGIEETKGTKDYQEAYQLLKQKDLNFTGNIEGYDLLTTDADIIVMDGFVGNIMLKSLEGSFDFFKNSLKEIMLKNFKGKLAALLIKNELSNFKKGLDPHQIACTPILGIKGLVVKVHGSATVLQMENAINETIKLVEEELIKRLVNNG